MGGNTLAQELIKITHAIRRQLFNDRGTIDNPERHPTSMQELFLVYMGREGQERDIFQKDLEAQFYVRRSTATEILKAMERKNLIVRQPVPHDKRAKKITLTQQAWEIYNANEKRIQDIENNLTRDFTQEEMKQLMSFMLRIRKNIDQRAV